MPKRLSGEEIQVARELCLSRFRYFCQAFTDPDFYDDLLHGRVCNYLQDDPSLDKLLIMGRVHLKTTIAATRYPLWRAIKNPEIRILNVGNTQPNAAKTVKEIRGIVESNTDFQTLFPEVIPHSFSRHWSDESASLAREGNFPEGTFESAGVGTAVTRRHYDLVIMDDTVAPEKGPSGELEQLPSPAQIDAAKGFHKQTVNLLIRFEKGERLLVGTRWGQFDHIQMVLDNELVDKGGRFSMLDIPAIDPLSGKAAYKGFSLESLATLRRTLGEYMFAMLYLNKPLASQFLKFKPENTRYYELGDVPEDGITIVTIDPADPPTGRADQCYTVPLAAKQCPGGLYVLEYIRERLSESGIVKAGLDLADKWGAIRIRIEADRYPNLAPAFKIEMALRNKQYIVEAVKTRGRSKEDRITRVTPLHENGLLFIRRNMGELETEMYSFPRGQTIDILDALAWQVCEDFQAPDYTVHTPTEKRNPRTFSLEQIEESFKRPARYPFEEQLAEVGR